MWLRQSHAVSVRDPTVRHLDVAVHFQPTQHQQAQCVLHRVLAVILVCCDAYPGLKLTKTTLCRCALSDVECNACKVKIRDDVELKTTDDDILQQEPRFNNVLIPFGVTFVEPVKFSHFGELFYISLNF